MSEALSLTGVNSFLISYCVEEIWSNEPLRGVSCVHIVTAPPTGSTGLAPICSTLVVLVKCPGLRRSTRHFSFITVILFFKVRLCCSRKIRLRGAVAEAGRRAVGVHGRGGRQRPPEARLSAPTSTQTTSYLPPIVNLHLLSLSGGCRGLKTPPPPKRTTNRKRIPWPRASSFKGQKPGVGDQWCRLMYLKNNHRLL